MAIVLFVLLLAAIILLIFGLQTFTAAKETQEDLNASEKDKTETKDEVEV